MRLILMVLASVMLTACVKNNSSSLYVPYSALKGRTCSIINLNGQEIKNDLNYNTNIINFGSNKNLSGSICNNFNGNVTLEKNKLQVTHFASTRKLCVDDVKDDLENQLFNMLNNGADLALSDNLLILKDKNNTIKCKFNK